MKHGNRFIDLTGQVFGRLTVDKYVEGQIQGHAHPSLWWCTCCCGVKKVIEGRHLKSGGTVSCGCYNRERASRDAKVFLLHITHGHAIRHRCSPEYRAWSDAKSRCYDKNNKVYHAYGGSGVRMCARWRNSFANFLADMGERPKGMHGHRSLYSLGRFVDTGNYKPSNCTWMTYTQQGIERRLKNKRRKQL